MARFGAPFALLQGRRPGEPDLNDTLHTREIDPARNAGIGNHFGRNKPDIFYDKSGSGNRFVGNHCNTSVPSRLCD